MKGLKSFLTAAFFAVCQVAVASKTSNVVDLHPKNFDEVVLKSGKPALVEFFAPWCGHCKKLAPTWEELADHFKANGDKVTIAKVDADNHKSLGKRFGIQGFPTLKWFDGESDTPIDYSSGRDLESLVSFISEKAGIKVKTKKEAPSDVVILTDSNFDSVVNGDKHVLVKFYAPWCGHCKALAPIWEKVATDLARDEDVIIAKLDAENAGSKAIAERLRIIGYPTLKYFPKGSTSAIDFDDGRTEDAIIGFVNKHAGTHRLPGGSLDASAGLIPSLDEIVKKFAEDASSLEEVAQEVKAAVVDLNDKYAPYYVKVIEKVTKSGDYVIKELDRLERVYAKGGLAPEKVDDITIRQNILRKFVSQSKPDVKDEL
ncbi:putative disulfide isomerase [Terfezia boudieri ATCC MYA-4762]|uniref:protein disulfide-isomerase n=1 Tax=Terfezia boudieri ATCC MYA-4762 TaxID=1051890 RepID=A0A3N4M8Q5_9PEZI|nr:putative disulfide isomerase [Terfezia boudieri ATCC MYA-4762]